MEPLPVSSYPDYPLRFLAELPLKEAVVVSNSLEAEFNRLKEFVAATYGPQSNVRRY